MTDKERILMAVITRIIPGLLYGNFDEKEKYVKSYMLNSSGLSKGDLFFEISFPFNSKTTISSIGKLLFGGGKI